MVLGISLQVVKPCQGLHYLAPISYRLTNDREQAAALPFFLGGPAKEVR